jgi:hypothetical protein
VEFAERAGAWYCGFLLDDAAILWCPGSAWTPTLSGSAGRAAEPPASGDEAEPRHQSLKAVLQRGEYGLKVVQGKDPLSIAFDLLTLARAHALLRQQSVDKLKDNFTRALAAIEASKSVLNYSPFYLARAAFLLDSGDDLKNARADLDAAWEIIHRCDMALYAVDANLLEARYFRSQGNEAEAARFLELAEMGIEKTGYGLRKLVAV